MIQVARREFEKGWQRGREAYSKRSAGSLPNNAHRLLLFYAVENGLKALIMRAEKIRDGEADFAAELHNLNRLIDRLKVGKAASLKLPETLKILNDVGGVRHCGVGHLNQVWRYGCVMDRPNDLALEEKLIEICSWIESELVAS